MWQSSHEKKNKRTVVRNLVKEFDNAKIDPKWMRNRKGDSQVEEMEEQEEELAKFGRLDWRESDVMEEGAANKRKDKEKRTWMIHRFGGSRKKKHENMTKAIQKEAGTSWCREREWEQKEGFERNASGQVVAWKFVMS